MMSGIKKALSWNMHGNYVTSTEEARFIQHINITRPPVTLVMDNHRLVNHLAATYPNMLTVYRRSGDNNHHLTGISPEDWLNPYLAECPPRPNLIYYNNNEPGASREAFAFGEACARLMAPIPHAGACFINLSTGVPEPDEWANGESFLRYIAQPGLRNRMILGVHEYALTNPAYEFMHPHQIDPRKWPTRVDGVGTLLGRWRQIPIFCRSRGFEPPLLIVSEFGFDDVTAYESWQQSLIHTPGHKRVGSLHGNKAQWEAWINQAGLGWSWERLAFEQLSRAYHLFYDDVLILGVLLFCYGGERGTPDKLGWREGYDFSAMAEFLDLMEKANWIMTNNAPSTPTTRWKYGMRVRNMPDLSGKTVGSIAAGTPSTTAFVADGYLWIPVPGGYSAVANLVTGELFVTEG